MADYELKPPVSGVDVVLDTDTYNEIDDQFALAYLLKNAPALNTLAILAAPFHNARSSSPADGMGKSYDEILRLLPLLGHSCENFVYRGSDRWLADENTPVDSPAARRLVEISQGYTKDRPLYVVAIGAITNVASAYLMDRALADRIVLVWLGGHAHHWHSNREFNLFQDVAAARVIFDSPIPFVQLPCQGCVSEFRISDADLDRYFTGKNPLCDYLARSVKEEVSRYTTAPWTRVIWDVTAVAWLLGGFMADRTVPAPIPQYDDTWAFAEGRRPMTYVYQIHRDKLFRDLVQKLGE